MSVAYCSDCLKEQNFLEGRVAFTEMFVARLDTGDLLTLRLTREWFRRNYNKYTKRINKDNFLIPPHISHTKIGYQDGAGI